MKKWLNRFSQEKIGGVGPGRAIAIFMLLTMLALVTDRGHLYMVKLDLKSAAQASANVGVQPLFIPQYAYELPNSRRIYHPSKRKP